MHMATAHAAIVKAILLQAIPMTTVIAPSVITRETPRLVTLMIMATAVSEITKAILPIVIPTITAIRLVGNYFYEAT